MLVTRRGNDSKSWGEQLFMRAYIHLSALLWFMEFDILKQKAQISLDLIEWLFDENSESTDANDPDKFLLPSLFCASVIYGRHTENGDRGMISIEYD